MPTDTQYADDIDIYREKEKYIKEELFPIAQNISQEQNLKVNATKTEYTNIDISINPKTKGLEEWKNS